MPDKWKSPDVAKDGSIKREEAVERDDNRRPWYRRCPTHARLWLSAFLLRQRSRAMSLVRWAGLAAFCFGALRLFAIGIYGMDGVGPIPLSVFTTVYLPGGWAPQAVYWELAWAWMGIGIAVVGLSTRRKRVVTR